MTMFTKSRDAELLKELAEYFKILSSDSMGMANRGYAKRENTIRAKVWEEAASDVLSINIVVDEDVERIRDAAPDLLEALEIALVWLDYEGKYDVQGIRAAIAKARG